MAAGINEGKNIVSRKVDIAIGNPYLAFDDKNIAFYVLKCRSFAIDETVYEQVI